jgi:hypothetical protein
MNASVTAWAAAPRRRPRARAAAGRGLVVAKPEAAPAQVLP